MNGALTFTLGLETQNFLRGLGLASGGIFSLIGAAQAVSKLMGSAWSAIGDGGRLFDLSARTGATVKDLYQLEEAFKMVGLSGDKVAPMLVRLQRGLGGVSDPAKELLNLAREIGASGPEGINLAKRIFGRESTGDIMQLARQVDDFAQSLKETDRASTKAQQTAAAFDRIGDSIQRIKTRLRGMWLDVAAEMAPAMEKGLNAMTEAFRTGRVSELIAESLKLGFSTILDFAPAIFEKLGVIIIKALEKPLTFFQAGLEYAIQKLGEQVMANPVARAFMNGLMGPGGIPFNLWAAKNLPMGYTAEPFQDIWKRWQETGPRFDVGLGEVGIPDMAKDADARWKKAMENFRKNFGSAFEFGPFKRGAGEGEDGFGLTKLNRPEGSALEKMGFVMGGGRVNYDADIAANTRETAKGVRTLIGVMGGGMPGGYTGALPT